ncbi:penicillin-binding protein 2 [Flexistipes sinusarabici]|nr:penicillin-binding protein 2 [Flexistipes sinusarabici]
MLFRFLEENVIAKYKKRSLLLFAVTFLFILLLFLRFYYLQVVLHDKYKRLSEDNRIRILRIKAPRGFIKDRDGEILVKNAPSYNLSVIREDTGDLNTLLGKLNNIVDLNVKEAKEKILKGYYYDPVTIFRGLNFKQVSYLYEHLKSFPGIRIEMDTVRSYKNGFAYSNLVGYMGEVNDSELKKFNGYRPGDLIGKTGLERVYEKRLKGINGAKQVEVNSLGQVVKVLKTKQAKPGSNVVLSMDYDLQKFGMELLKEKVGTIVVLDIYNNRVLLMATNPSYNLEKFVPFIESDYWNTITNDPDKPMLNRAIEGSYPPGSVFKVLMAAAGLTENIITQETTFECNGVFYYGSYDYKCWKEQGHGEVDLKKSIVESCDIYYYNLGLKLGIDTISRYAHNFSLGRKTGIDLTNEKSGLFPDRKWKEKAFDQPWYPGETIITSIGQGYTNVTPLQMAVMLSGIFNGGMIYQPSLVKGFETADGFEAKPVKINNRVDIDNSTRDFLLNAMYNAVYGLHGTAYRARVSEIKIGGKTGTAQVVSLKKFEQYEEGEVPAKYRDHSWFGGVFPVEEPRYVIVSLIEHGGSGGHSAASISGAVINKMVSMGYVSD